MRILLIGIQGSGKSTQGNLLSENLGIPYLSTGHILREISKEKTPEGRRIKETINAGFLVADEEMIPIVEDYLSRPEYVKGYILDGFPRTVAQAKAFKENITAAMYFNISDKEALWRLTMRDDGREDATIKAIKKRVELFHRFTEPVLDFYRDKGILHEINGEKSIDEIHEEILSKLSVNSASAQT